MSSSDWSKSSRLETVLEVRKPLPDLTVRGTSRGRRLVLSREIACAPDRAWKAIAEVQYWPDWGPLITDVTYPHRTVRENSSGRIELLSMVNIPFRIRSVDADRRTWIWTVAGCTPPSDGHRVESLGQDRSRIVFELPLWAPVYLPVCLRATGNLRRQLDGRSNT